MYKNPSLNFILLLGTVSLFSDITYEGARSITGPYLFILGASGAIVGFISGIGEFSGYALRLLSGYLADRTKSYWTLTFIGYAINLLAVPLLAFAGNWIEAAVLLIIERIGKAIRTPSRDAMLSYATKQTGRGWGFAIHEAMDQIGAIAGPAIIYTALFFKAGYRFSLGILFIPALLALLSLTVARISFPTPQSLEVITEPLPSYPVPGFSRIFWIYMIFTLLTVSGFVPFQIIAYHLKSKAITTDSSIAALYAFAMGVDALFALVIGKAYDRFGIKSLIVIPPMMILIPLLSFSPSLTNMTFGLAIWGATMAIQETIMRASLADITRIEKRGFGYGIFNSAYGFSLLISGTITGYLYDINLHYIVIFTLIMQMLSLLPLFYIFRQINNARS